jgi:hypothetical protein
MNLPTVTKSSKRNLHKKLSRYAKKAKLTNLTIEKETAPTLDIGDDKNDKAVKITSFMKKEKKYFMIQIKLVKCYISVGGGIWDIFFSFFIMIVRTGSLNYQCRH